MKNVKFVALALVLSMVLMGAGYAQWTDNAKINYYAETGNLSVKFVNAGTAQQDPNGVYTVETKKLDDTTIQVTMKNLYPGAESYIDYQIINDGSIPVKFASAEVSYDSTNPVTQYLGVMTPWEATIDGQRVLGNYIHGPFDNVWHGYKDSWFALTDWANRLNADAKIGTLTYKTGDIFKLDWTGDLPEGVPSTPAEGPGCIRLKVADDAPNSIQQKAVTFTFKVNFKQFNQ